MSDMTYAVHTETCTYLLDDDGVCLWTLSPGGHAAAATDRCVGAQFVACLDLTAPGGLVGELRLGAAALFVRREHGRFVLLRTLPIDRVEERARSEEDSRAYRSVLTSQDATAVLGPGESIALLARRDALRAPTDDHPAAQTHPLPDMFAPPDPAVPPPVARTLPSPAATRGMPAPPMGGMPAPPPARIAEPVLETHPLPEPWARPAPIDAAMAAREWAAQQAIAARAAATEPRRAIPAPPLRREEPAEDEIESLDLEDLVSISVTEITREMPLYRASAYALPPPAPPPRRAPPSPEGSGPPTPRGPPPERRGVVGPGRRLR